jgi:hypothetical protein
MQALLDFQEGLGTHLLRATEMRRGEGEGICHLYLLAHTCII